MAIPDFDGSSGNLPPGDHPASLKEVEAHFAGNPRRRRLMGDLRSVVEDLWERGVVEIYIVGSFVTGEERPRDVDVLYVPPAGSDPTTWGVLSPLRRAELKALRHVDLWMHPAPQPVPGNPFKKQAIKEFFSEDRNGAKKGLVQLIQEDGAK